MLIEFVARTALASLRYDHHHQRNLRSLQRLRVSVSLRLVSSEDERICNDRTYLRPLSFSFMNYQRRGPRRSEPFPSGSAHNAGAKRRHSDGFPFQRKRQRRTRTDPGLNISRPIPFSISRETEEGVPGIIIAFRGFPNNVPPPTRLEFQEVLEDLFAEFQDDRGKVINFDVFMRVRIHLSTVTRNYSHVSSTMTHPLHL